MRGGAGRWPRWNRRFGWNPRGQLGREPDQQRFSFFFSSRRRHTILKGDWSSDVCSSDLFLSFLPRRSSLDTPRARRVPYDRQRTTIYHLAADSISSRAATSEKCSGVAADAKTWPTRSQPVTLIIWMS